MIWLPSPPKPKTRPRELTVLYVIGAFWGAAGIGLPLFRLDCWDWLGPPGRVTGCCPRRTWLRALLLSTTRSLVPSCVNHPHFLASWTFLFPLK